MDYRGQDLRGKNFSDEDLSRADFTDADLSGAVFQRTRLDQAVLTRAKLRGADLIGAVLHMANLDDADLTDANLMTAQMIAASARGANFSGASLEVSVIVNSNFTGATLVGTKIFGLSAWNVDLTDAKQEDLIITRSDEPSVTCDDIEIAQFLYLLLENAKIRKVIDTVTSKVVLILGRFTEERKRVLDAIREALRHLDYTPILFDFDKPASKDVTGTVETLARMSRFIIADLTDPSSIPHELATIVPFLRKTPILPIRLEGSTGYSMFDDFVDAYRWVLPIQSYRDEPSLIAALPALIAPADQMAEKFRT